MGICVLSTKDSYKKTSRVFAVFVPSYIQISTAMKLQSDPVIVLYAVSGIVAVFILERLYLSRWLAPQAAHEH